MILLISKMLIMNTVQGKVHFPLFPHIKLANSAGFIVSAGFTSVITENFLANVLLMSKCFLSLRHYQTLLKWKHQL